MVFLEEKLAFILFILKIIILKIPWEVVCMYVCAI